MSKEALDEENIEKPDSVETPEEKKETPTQEKSETSKYEGLTAEQLLEKLSEKDKAIHDKHNMGLSAQKELDELKQKQKQKEEEDNISELEKKGQYEELMETIKGTQEAKDAEIARLTADSVELNAIKEARRGKALEVIPEDKQHLATSMDLNQLEEFSSLFGNNTENFGGPLKGEKTKQKGSRIEELNEKHANGTISPLENAERNRIK